MLSFIHSCRVTHSVVCAVQRAGATGISLCVAWSGPCVGVCQSAVNVDEVNAQGYSVRLTEALTDTCVGADKAVQVNGNCLVQQVCAT